MAGDKIDTRGGARPGAGRPHKENKGKNITLNLPPETIEMLKEKAKAKGLSLNKFVASLIDKA